LRASTLSPSAAFRASADESKARGEASKILFVLLLFLSYAPRMMLSLSIRDFVLISRLDLSPGEGFTALTG
jgi:hypothetical protein